MIREHDDSAADDLTRGGRPGGSLQRLKISKTEWLPTATKSFDKKVSKLYRRWNSAYYEKLKLVIHLTWLEG